MASLYVWCSVVLAALVSPVSSASIAPLNNCRPLRSPLNGLMQCAHTGNELLCTAVCSPGYVFANGMRSVKHTCTEATGSWDDKTFPFCILANTSTCPNLVNTEHAVVDCMSDDSALLCTIYCYQGYLMENGADMMTKICDEKTMTWKDGPVVPPCIAGKPGCTERLLAAVNDSQISASSVWTGLQDFRFDASRARLDSPAELGDDGVVKSGGWRPASNTLDQYIQVDLGKVYRISGIVTRGRGVLPGDTAVEYVKRFRVLSSQDGTLWEPYSSQTVNDQFIDGNVDNDSPVTHMFACPFDARYVRVNPLAWNQNIALRFDLLGCPSNGSPTRCADRITTTTTAATSTTEATTTTTTVAPTTRLQRTPTRAKSLPTTTSTGSRSPGLDLCFPMPPPVHGIIHCETEGDKLVCVARCQEGYIFDSSVMYVTRRCEQASGNWPDGQGLPTCIADAGVTPLPPTHNYTSGCLRLKKDCKVTGNGDFQACGDCHFFATCSEGYLYVRACPEMLLFDTVTQQCEYHSRSCTPAQLVG